MPANWRNVERITAGFVVCAFGVNTIALADTTGGSPPVFLMSWDATGDSLDQFNYDPNDFGTREFGTWQLGGTVNTNQQSPAFGHVMDGAPRTRTGWQFIGGLSNTAWSMDWKCVVNEDPFVDATINVTNNSLSAQTFFVYMPLNINPSIPGGTLMNSYVSAVVSDNTFDSATFETNGTDPVFRGYIDGNVVGANAQLWQPGYQLTAGSFQAANDDDQLLNQIGPAANNQIALRLEFTLSAGDSASVTGTFEIQPIPGPAALGLFAVAATVSRRRRA